MTLSSTELTELAQVAVEAAAEAGRMIAQSRPAHIEHKPEHSSPASQVVTEVDRRSEALILQRLQPTLERFSLGLLTEEQPDDGGRFTADYFWCIDPIDGTLPFIENTPGYAVSVALVQRDGTPAIGVVCDPVEGTVRHAIAGVGGFLNGASWQLPASHSTRLSLFTDRSFRSSPKHDEMIVGLQGISESMGLAGLDVDASAGAVMNACRVLTNAPACYVKLPKTDGGGSLWDYAATACLFAEAGTVATDVFGQPLDLNRADSTLMCHKGILFATDQHLAGQIRDLVSRVSS